MSKIELVYTLTDVNYYKLICRTDHVCNSVQYGPPWISSVQAGSRDHRLAIRCFFDAYHDSHGLLRTQGTRVQL